MSQQAKPIKPVRVDDYRWMIPKKDYPFMRVDGMIYATKEMIEKATEDAAVVQVANVASLPAIVGRSMAMPDIHYGYGFPIGGVAATRVEDGVISPGGVGYDINCGVRLLRTNLELSDIEDKIEALLYQLARDVPAGVGSKHQEKLSERDLDEVARRGAQWAVAMGYGTAEDIEHTEARGCLEGADPAAVSDRAKQRGRPQLGTLGSGNHFLEIGVVDKIYDPEKARVMGLAEGQITVLIHTGSRGYGYQICDDSLKLMQNAVNKYNIKLPDRQLACAPVKSPEGQRYLAAMACAANYAWANRQMITHLVRQSFERVLGAGREKLGLELIYDVAHNIAKIEEHEVDGERVTLCVHRKGATRAFPPGHPELPPRYREIGQPVLVPGDMGTYSYVLVGTQRAMDETFGSTCHGAGRLMSRAKAKRHRHGAEVVRELRERGILVHSPSKAGIAEEQPDAYKDVSQVVEATEGAGISTRVARMRPLAVLKG